MRANGICYDTGFLRPGSNSRRRFDSGLVRRELTVIRDDLHCDAVHLTGGDPERLELAARHAADLGLEIWFSPYPLELGTEEMLRLFADCAERAERIRRRGAEVVFVTGVELSVMNQGFLDGADTEERLTWLLADPELRADRMATASTRVNAFLRDAVTVVRERFHGSITYAAIPFEGVDWSPFDFVTYELIRSAEVADRFREGVRGLTAQRKPVAVTGFGTATWRGAGEVAPRSMEVLENDPVTGAPLRLTRRLRARRGGPGGLPPRAAGDIRQRGRRQRLRLPLRPRQPAAPPGRRPTRRPRPGQPRHRQGSRRRPRRDLSRHALGAEGGLRGGRGVLRSWVSGEPARPAVVRAKAAPSRRKERP